MQQETCRLKLEYAERSPYFSSHPLCARDEVHTRQQQVCASDEAHTRQQQVCASDEAHTRQQQVCASDEVQVQRQQQQQVCVRDEVSEPKLECPRKVSRDSEFPRQQQQWREAFVEKKNKKKKKKKKNEAERSREIMDAEIERLRESLECKEAETQRLKETLGQKNSEIERLEYGSQINDEIIECYKTLEETARSNLVLRVQLNQLERKRAEWNMDHSIKKLKTCTQCQNEF